MNFLPRSAQQWIGELSASSTVGRPCLIRQGVLLGMGFISVPAGASSKRGPFDAIGGLHMDNLHRGCEQEFILTKTYLRAAQTHG